MTLFNAKQSKIQGYLYITAKDDIKLFQASIGSKFIKSDRKPPWLVVNHSLDGIIVTEWPGRLLKVEILDGVNEMDLNKGLVKDVWYTRTLGVEILEVVPTQALFEPNGVEIVQILDFISEMSEEAVNKLNQFELKNASKIYSNAWNEWLKMKDVNSIHMNQDHSNTLAIYANNSRATMNRSFSVISNLVWKRAKSVLGDSAFTVDEDGELVLNARWSHATDALLHAAMAMHGRDFISNEDKIELWNPWNSLITNEK
ncbi:MAG: hypothetical protein ACFHU9_05915 [Fluviicola sp.]